MNVRHNFEFAQASKLAEPRELKSVADKSFAYVIVRK